MKNLKIRTRILISFGVILMLMVIVAAVGYNRLVQIERLSDRIAADSVPGLNYTSQVLVSRTANYSLTQEYVLQPDMGARQKLEEAIAAGRVAMDTLMPNTGARVSCVSRRAWTTT